MVSLDTVPKQNCAKVVKMFSTIHTSNIDGFSVIFLVMCEISLYFTDSSCSSVTVSVALYDEGCKDLVANSLQYD